MNLPISPLHLPYISPISPLYLRQVHWALMEVVEVFGYMHSCAIMYRDLKPENLLVDDEGHVRYREM